MSSYISLLPVPSINSNTVNNNFDESSVIDNNLNMANFKIYNLANASSQYDAINYGQTIDLINNKFPISDADINNVDYSKILNLPTSFPSKISTLTVDGSLNMNNFAINTSKTTNFSDNEMVPKSYIDNAINNIPTSGPTGIIYKSSTDSFNTIASTFTNNTLYYFSPNNSNYVLTSDINVSTAQLKIYSLAGYSGGNNNTFINSSIYTITFSSSTRLYVSNVTFDCNIIISTGTICVFENCCFNGNVTIQNITGYITIQTCSFKSGKTFSISNSNAGLIYMNFVNFSGVTISNSLQLTNTSTYVFLNLCQNLLSLSNGNNFINVNLNSTSSDSRIYVNTAGFFSSLTGQRLTLTDSDLNSSNITTLLSYFLTGKLKLANLNNGGSVNQVLSLNSSLIPTWTTISTTLPTSSANQLLISDASNVKTFSSTVPSLNCLNLNNTASSAQYNMLMHDGTNVQWATGFNGNFAFTSNTGGNYYFRANLANVHTFTNNQSNTLIFGYDSVTTKSSFRYVDGLNNKLFEIQASNTPTTSSYSINTPTNICNGINGNILIGTGNRKVGSYIQIGDNTYPDNDSQSIYIGNAPYNVNQINDVPNHRIYIGSGSVENGYLKFRCGGMMQFSNPNNFTMFNPASGVFTVGSSILYKTSIRNKSNEYIWSANSITKNYYDKIINCPIYTYLYKKYDESTGIWSNTESINQIYQSTSFEYCYDNFANMVEYVRSTDDQELPQLSYFDNLTTSGLVNSGRRIRKGELENYIVLALQEMHKFILTPALEKIQILETEKTDLQNQINILNNKLNTLVTYLEQNSIIPNNLV